MIKIKLVEKKTRRFVPHNAERVFTLMLASDGTHKKYLRRRTFCI
jgi:hypothetical protein